MRYFLDTEFIENGITIKPLSIGIVAEDEREFYAELYIPADFPGDWALENVYPKLGDKKHSPLEVIDRLETFIGNDESPEFWADYAAYDWIVLCQLYGKMIELPKSFPMFCRDIQQDRARLDIDHFPEELDSENPHHALADAWEVKRRYDYMQTK